MIVHLAKKVFFLCEKYTLNRACSTIYVVWVWQLQAKQLRSSEKNKIITDESLCSVSVEENAFKSCQL